MDSNQGNRQLPQRDSQGSSQAVINRLKNEVDFCHRLLAAIVYDAGGLLWVTDQGIAAVAGMDMTLERIAAERAFQLRLSKAVGVARDAHLYAVISKDAANA